MLDPTKSKLTRGVRIGIMISLIAAFFVISPIIILYTSGYRYDFKENKIKQTGVISIDVEPSDAKIFINDIEIKKKLPLRLTNIAPKTYWLRLEMPGYKTWKKEIIVQSKQTTYVKNLQLLKEALPIKSSADKPEIKAIYTSQFSENLIMLVSENEEYQILFVDAQSGKESALFEYAQNDPPILSVSPFHDTLLAINGNDEKTTAKLFSFNNKQIPRTFKFIHKKPIEYQWSRQPGVIYVKINDSIRQLTSAGGNKIVGETDADLWYVENSGIVWTIENRQLTSLNNGQQPYDISQNARKIIDINEHYILLKTDAGIIILDRKSKEAKSIENISADDISYRYATKEWLLWSDWEIWSIYEDGNYSLLNRHGQKIRSVKPLDKFGLVLLADVEQLSAFNPGYYTNQHLFPSQNILQAEVIPNKRIIYLLGTIGQTEGLFELEY